MNTTLLVVISVFSIIVLFRARLATWIFLTFSIVQLGWLDRYVTGVEGYRRFSLIVGLMLALRIALDLISGSKRISKSHIFLKPLIPLAITYLVVTIISNYYNNESILLGLYSLRYYLIGYIACISIYFYNHNILTIGKLKLALIAIGLLQIPFSVFKYIYAGAGSQYTLDSVSGTFSGYGELLGCQVICIAIVVYDKLQYGIKYFKINSYILSLLLISY